MANTKRKRSQAALEFLMTYGWAILVVLIVISALAYFGVLNPQTLLPTRCSMPTGFGCQDYVAKKADNNITLAITNGLGKAVTITNITLTGQGVAPGCSSKPQITPAAPVTLANGGQATITFDCMPPLSMGPATGNGLIDLAGGSQKYRWTIDLAYHASDSTAAFTKTLQGELFTTLE